MTVGGTVKSVADLHAAYLDGNTLAQVRTGMSFLISQFTAAGWYRVFTSTYTNVVYATEVILHIGRTYISPQNEHYSFSICVGYNGDISITQLSGVMGGHLITKIRVVWDNSQIFHIDIYSAASSYSNTYGVTGQGYGTFYAFTPNAAIPSGYTAYEFTTVDGCKSDRGFTGTLSGNATSATKLQTARTLWGQSFDGTGNVSGALTGVTSITASNYVKADYFDGDYVSNYNTDKTYWVGDAARGISSDKAGLLLYAYSSRNIYLYTNSTQRMVVNASGSVGIGTISPAYKLDVAGEIRATQGITIGGTDDFGWYPYNGRLSTCLNSTIGINTYSLLVSNAWADYSKVPENGIYSKGEIVCSSDIYPDVTASVKLGSATKRWLGVYAQNGNFSGNVSVSSLNVVTEATVKTLVPDKLHLPSSLGNDVFDIYVDTEVNIDGETPVSVSFQPQWYGWINADGTAAKQGGSATLTAVRTAAGTLRLNGIAADSTVIAVPATFITGSTASPRTTASVLKSGSVHYVQTYNNAGTRANLAFYLLVI